LSTRITDRGEGPDPGDPRDGGQTECDWAAALGQDRFAQLRELLLEPNQVVELEASAPEQFMQERLMPAMAGLETQGAPPSATVSYELHGYQGGR
jgi:hypothetical protein